MANPKRRHSHRRARLGKASVKLARPTLRPCPRCNAMGPPHAVCDNCGHYDGRLILDKDED